MSIEYTIHLASRMMITDADAQQNLVLNRCMYKIFDVSTILMSKSTHADYSFSLTDLCKNVVIQILFTSDHVQQVP